MSRAAVFSIVPHGRTGHETVRFHKRDGMTWRDYLITLLQLASEVEHGLMVQYLYAAYTLGGPDLSPENAEDVAKWQRSILDVAKEEMGHLLTVQNILALLGAPPNFTRAETPAEAALSPIPFVLAPLTRDVAASFTFAEMSPEIDAHLAKSEHLRKGLAEFLREHQERPITQETRELARKIHADGVKPQPVALLYEEIIRVIGDERRILDTDLDEASYEAQASWDDWGRGYAPRPKLLSPGGELIKAHGGAHRANVIVLRAATRTEALQALHAISGQGEAVHLQHPHKVRHGQKAPESVKEEPSHFERFLEIWQHYPKEWKPHLDVIWNPVTRPSTAPFRTVIHDRNVLDWALLFNIRYRMLLTFLAHSYRLSRVVRQGEPNLRGMVMHRAFGEMYNIKSIAGLMVQMKLRMPDGAERRAGPPFEMPYSLNMPAAHVDVWRLHRDLYRGSLDLIDKLRRRGEAPGQAYLQSLRELDTAALSWVESFLSGSHMEMRA